jgi:uncharacterized protein YukE
MPPSDVHVDPDRLRAIAEELGMFSGDIRTELTLLDGELARLGRSWQDEEYTKFKRAIQPLRKVLDQFQQEIARSKPDMLADAEAIRAYQRLKTP